MENVKDRIIHGATEMFLVQGIKTVTMDDIAFSLGMSKRTIYENFGDKLQLLKECLKYHECAKQREWNALLQSSVVELLHKKLRETSANVVEHSREFRFFQELKKYYPTLCSEVVESFFEKNLEQVGMYIEKGVSEGVFLPDTNAKVTASILIAQTDMFIQSDRFATVADVMELMRHMSIIFFRGISTPKGIAEIDAMLKRLEEEEKGK